MQEASVTCVEFRQSWPSLQRKRPWRGSQVREELVGEEGQLDSSLESEQSGEPSHNQLGMRAAIP